MYEVGGTPFVVDDKYELIKQVGSGAYGVVASALNRQTNKKVAIKKVIISLTIGDQCFWWPDRCKADSKRNKNVE